MKFRKKPVVVEAIKFNGMADSVYEMCDRWKRFGFLDVQSFDGTILEIITLEGTHLASRGDWIIKGVKNEFYPCNPEIFEMTYEPVAE